MNKSSVALISTRRFLLLSSGHPRRNHSSCPELGEVSNAKTLKKLALYSKQSQGLACKMPFRD